ncbi:MAG: SPFH domain-containing protein [Patescibacteria group bacterium]
MSSDSRSNSSSSFVEKNFKKLVIVAVGLIILLFFNPVVIVQSGSCGLLFQLGALKEKVLKEGVSLRVPILQSVKTISVRPQKIDFKVEVGQDGAITKDNQTIGSVLIVFYKYKAESLVKMWRDIGTDKMESIITQTVRENFKKVIGGNTIFEIAPNQEKIRARTIEITKSALNKYPIEITELKITNYDWNDAFDKQIEETMKRAQQVKQKEQELLVAEQESQKKVKQAEADKEATIKVAEGRKEAARLDAEAKVLTGEGIRKFNESIRATKDIEMQLRQLEIESKRIDRWNGQYVANNNYGPIPISQGVIQGQK